MSKSWLYHKDFDAKIFDDSEVEELEKNGWVDTPDKLTETHPGDMSEFSRDQLIKLALDGFGVNLDSRKTDANLVKEVEALFDDSSTTN